MKCCSVPFTKVDQDEEFKQLALETGGQLEAGNTIIRCAGSVASGKIQRWHLDAGLYMRVSDLVFSEPIELRKEAAPLYITHAGFHLIVILTPGTITLKSVNQHQQLTKVRERVMLLAPDTVNMVMQATPGEPVQIIDFQIAPYWLRNQPGYAQVATYFEDMAFSSHELPVLIETCTKKMSQQAVKIFESALAGYSLGELFNFSEQLIVEFLGSLKKIESEKTCGNIAMYYQKMLQTEEILNDYLHSTLPRLENLAQQVALSESTLKRYFKMVFGKSIYEYYLIKKMEKAHKLLLEKPLTVNEAAELMGYEKVSNFIDIFKKHHGYSPGTIRKKNGLALDTRNTGTFIA